MTLAKRGPEASLELLTKAKRFLAEARDPGDVKKFRQDHVAYLQWLKRRHKEAKGAQAQAGLIVALADKWSRTGYKAAGPGAVPGPGRGKKGPGTVPGPFTKSDFANAVGVDERRLQKWKSLDALSEKQIEAAVDRLVAEGEDVTTAAIVRITTQTSGAADYDGDEWYTPPDFLDLVREVLGEIDLDPASNAHAQKTVGAKDFFTKRDNGLSKQWPGRVFCNPPYSMPLIEQFTDKLIDEVGAERTKAAIFLVNNCTDSGWFHSLLLRFPVCFTRGRIGFLDHSGQKFGTRQGQAIFYAGPNRSTFVRVFSRIGQVLVVEQA